MVKDMGIISIKIKMVKLENWEVSLDKENKEKIKKNKLKNEC